MGEHERVFSISAAATRLRRITVRLTPERNALLSGNPVTTLLDSDPTTLPNSTDFLYWQETEFGLKPTIRVSHVVIQERPELIVVASKMLYASHYFWTALISGANEDEARGVAEVTRLGHAPEIS